MLNSLNTRQELPNEIHFLLDGYPRDGWTSHPNFARSIQNWLGAHQMFRQLGEILLSKTQRFMDNQIDGAGYVTGLGQYGDMLIRNLHGHHTWEDRSYFPELARADQRFQAGQELLESDHLELDNLLDDITQRSNRVIKLFDLDPSQIKNDIGPLREEFAKLSVFLNRHLTDEEDLIVPILLHHKMRG